jgi:8-oxo-dGTP pyrophosphatase MutT (NUDIX family)
MAVKPGSSPAAAAVLLQRHGSSARDPIEQEMISDALSFIAAHPDCLYRTCLKGHLTGSAWIVNAPRDQALLVHHRKLDRWLQPGGHADGDSDLAAVALREANEETGLSSLRLVIPEIFDFDRHWIPERGPEPGHWHYDFRFLIEADPAAALVISEESNQLRWFPLEAIAAVAQGGSLLRMVAKTAALATATK